MSNEEEEAIANQSPLANPVFRAIWIASVASNIGTWVQDVGTAWLMTTLAPSPIMVALVQAAATAPMFVLALPAGALADIVDRRKLILLAQLWMLLAAASLAVLTFTENVTPFVLLAITFALGIGFALNSPAWQAIVPDLVPSQQLDSAVTLTGVGINVARAIGPAIGGVLVARAGPEAAFLFNSVSYVGVLFVLYRWQPVPTGDQTPKESIGGAIAIGVRYVNHNPIFQIVLLRTLAFIFFGSALWAHLPLIAKEQLGTEAGGYGLLLGTIGIGAVGTAFLLPRLRKRVSSNSIVTGSTVGLAAAFVAMGFIASLPSMCLALLPVGAFWVANLSSLNVSAQTTIAQWVKARALAVYLLVFFGGMSSGAIFWGVIASQLGIQYSLVLAASGMIVTTIATLPFPLTKVEKQGLLPSLHWPVPYVALSTVDHSSPVIVTIEYQVAGEDQEGFLQLMKKLRRSRLRTGAYRWFLSQDVADHERWIETFFVASWSEHERQHHRVSHEDALIQSQIAALHFGDDPPVVSHKIVRYS
ncbi:MFS transporter [Bremerella cremea]|uniref:MFS transporter n=1 Tax=Blastopirellula marina TaxID=124 RepID=A0A2S8FCL8_9BACT|nr:MULTISPECIES: MFS transporter [Pirellulaceae]PQO29898.1 MFS transporter [Blastopirellula marina]RCS43201.1 MFS transporter [Bremerella cremea]